MLMQQQDIGYTVYALLQKILQGQWRLADPCPEVGVWQGIVEQVVDAYRQGYRQEGTIEHAQACASRTLAHLKLQYHELAALLGEEGAVVEVEAESQSFMGRAPLLPHLSGHERGPSLDGLGGDACQWLDAYIAFSKQWSTRGYELFHEAVGLWLLSAIAMRRIYIPLLQGIYTPLYIGLASDSSKYRKSTTVDIGRATLQAAGLSSIFITDYMTPPVFIRRGARFVPENYGQLSMAGQRKVEERLLYGGRQSYYIDEFLNYLHALSSGSGPYAGFRDIFLRYYDCPPDYGNETIGRGLDFVERPYMAAIANFTPAHVRELPTKGATNLWQDGTWPRWVFITPPEDAKPSGLPMPDEMVVVPESISKPLARWHERLGKPKLAMVASRNHQDKETGRYEAQTDWGEPFAIRMERGVKAAYDAYDRQVNYLLHTGTVPEDLHTWYVRSTQRTLRVAALFASFENGNVLELRHFARAQQIAERWRQCAHNFYKQSTEYSAVTEERRLDNKVMEKMREAYEKGELRVSLSYLQQRIGGASVDQLRHSVDALVRAEMLLAHDEFGGKGKTRRMTRYSLPAANPPPE